MMIRISEIMGIITSLYIAVYFSCRLYEEVQKTRITNKVAKIFCVDHLNNGSIIIRMFAQLNLMSSNSFSVRMNVLYGISNLYYLIVGVTTIVLMIRNHKEVNS